jgi:hypothetical protein
MMRAYTPGGRFTTEFELNAIGDGITSDLTNPVGTFAEWWSFNKAASTMDPVYDVDSTVGGRIWTGPANIHVISANWMQGNVQSSERGFYNADMLTFTVNIDDLIEVSPELFESRGAYKAKISEANRYRAVWKEQVYRPYHVQPDGYLDDRGTLITIRMIQVMPDELINDAQFQQYANGTI